MGASNRPHFRITKNSTEMKTLLATLNNPLVVLAHAVLGTSLMVYLQDAAYQALLWFLPCMFVILADLVAGVQAARHRKERVTFSTGCRRTVNKALCYIAWILFCVCMNKQYESTLPTFLGVGFVFFVEGCSFIGNILEPKGYSLSIKALLLMIGKRHNAEGLEDVIEKKD